MSKVRGRFYVEKDCDGWTVVDSKTSGCLSFDTKSEADGAATFARQYVRKWGEIDFQSFPYSLDEAPVVDEGRWCSECRCKVESEAGHDFCGRFYDGHDIDCSRYGMPLRAGAA